MKLDSVIWQAAAAICLMDYVLLKQRCRQLQQLTTFGVFRDMVSRSLIYYLELSGLVYLVLAVVCLIGLVDGWRMTVPVLVLLVLAQVHTRVALILGRDRAMLALSHREQDSLSSGHWVPVLPVRTRRPRGLVFAIFVAWITAVACALIAGAAQWVISNAGTGGQYSSLPATRNSFALLTIVYIGLVLLLMRGNPWGWLALLAIPPVVMLLFSPTAYVSLPIMFLYTLMGIPLVTPTVREFITETARGQINGQPWLRPSELPHEALFQQAKAKAAAGEVRFQISTSMGGLNENRADDVIFVLGHALQNYGMRIEAVATKGGRMTCVVYRYREGPETTQP